jgi:hypothetical protein
MTGYEQHLERKLRNYPQDGEQAGNDGPARIPVKDKVTSVFGLGPIAPLQVVKADALVAEANRICDRGAGGELTHAEHVVLAGPLKRAKAGLERQAKGPIEKQIGLVKDLFAGINIIDHQLVRAQEVRLIGPHREQLSPDEAQSVHDALLSRAVRETDEGSKKHHIRREGRGAALREILLIGIDLPIFVYAMCSLLNVNLRLVVAGDAPSLINFTVAFVFGLFGTVVFAKLMRTMGRRHRRFKGSDSSIDAGTEAAWLRLRGEQALTLLILIAVAFVMGARVFSEGLQAQADAALTVSLCIMLALLVAASGYINYQGEYENGSEETDGIGHLSAQLGAHASYVEGLHKQRAVLVEAAGNACALLARMIIKATERAGRTVVTSTTYRTVRIARSYARITDPILVPGPVSEAFAAAERQAAEFAAHHEMLARTNHD